MGASTLMAVPAWTNARLKEAERESELAQACDIRTFRVTERTPPPGRNAIIARKPKLVAKAVGSYFGILLSVDTVLAQQLFCRNAKGIGSSNCTVPVHSELRAFV
jgi:hypothetical protein